jgi:hypothetical protein
MANRRRAFGNALLSVSDVFKSLLEGELSKKERREQAELQSRLRTEERLAGTQGSILQAGLQNPQIFERMDREGAGLHAIGVPDVGGFGRSPAERGKPILEELGKATSLSELPSGEEVVQRYRAEGPIKDLQDINNLLSARRSRKENLSAEERKTGMFKKEFDPSTGAEMERFIPTPDLPGTSLQTSPTTSQAIGIANQTEAGTRGERIRTAGQQAGAVASAQVGPGLRLHRGKAEIDSEFAPAEDTTESERRAGSLFVPVLAAHTQATQQEKTTGASLGPVAINSASSPTFSAAADWIPGLKLSDSEKQYLQTAVDWTNTYAYMRSGVTVRPDEFPRYLQTFFKMKTDDPGTITQKQQARAVMMAATQIAVGGAKAEAGEKIGLAINQGILPLGVLQVMRFDPEIAAGIAETIKENR